MRAAINDLAGRERDAADALALLVELEIEHHAAEQALLQIAQRRTQARAAAEKANGRVHLARLRAMLARG